MKESKLIKRYQNRKLYDTNVSKYVTLKDIARMIRTGYDVRIVENTTNEDITAVILSQIIFEEEKSRRHLLPLHYLKKVIQFGGGSLAEFIDKHLIPPGTSLEKLREEAQTHIQKLVKAREISSEEGRRIIKALLENPQKGLEEIQRIIDNSISRAFELIRIPTRREIKRLDDRIEQLINKLDRLEKIPTPRKKESKG